MLQLCKIYKNKKKKQAEIWLGVECSWKGEPLPSGAQQGGGCVFLLRTHSFSHTDLVPTVGPGSKDPVTAPITGLRSLSNNTIAPLRRCNRGVPSGAEMKAFGRGAQGQSASVGLRRVSSQAGLTLRIRFFSFRAVFGPSGSQSAGVTCDSSDRN